MKKVKIIALLAAILAAVLIFFFFNTLSKSGLGDTTEVVTAMGTIPANTAITEEMLQVKAVPDAALLSGYITEKEQVIGKVTKADIFSGEQILLVKLIAPGEIGNDTLAYAIEPGMRAITVSVDANTGLAGMLRPQNRIDLICDLEYPPTGAEPKSYSIVLAENVKILAVDNVLSENGKRSEEEGAAAYSTLTLEVNPAQTLEISMAVHSGQLRTVLRSPLDETITNLPNITVDTIMAN